MHETNANIFSRAKQAKLIQQIFDLKCIYDYVKHLKITGKPSNQLIFTPVFSRNHQNSRKTAEISIIYFARTRRHGDLYWLHLILHIFVTTLLSTNLKTCPKAGETSIPTFPTWFSPQIANFSRNSRKNLIGVALQSQHKGKRQTRWPQVFIYTNKKKQKLR